MSVLYTRESTKEEDFYTVAKGDESHKAAAQMMADMRKNPASGMEWYMKTKSDFEALLDD